MYRNTLLIASCSLLLCASRCAAFGVPEPVFVIEPDNYADGTVLNSISPLVTLSTGAFSDNRPTFDVVASTDPEDASTGAKVFAHGGGVSFFNSGRTFRMDFPSPPRKVELDYIASGFFDNLYLGRIEGYDTAGNLIEVDETALLAGGQFETLTLSAPGIAYAIAYPPEDSFGDFDFLRITAPEPTGLLLAATAFAVAAGGRSRAGRARTAIQ